MSFLHAMLYKVAAKTNDRVISREQITTFASFSQNQDLFTYLFSILVTGDVGINMYKDTYILKISGADGEEKEDREIYKSGSD